MVLNVFMAFSAAAASLLLALAVLFGQSKSIANVAFTVAMLGLGLETAFDGLSFLATSAESVTAWQSNSIAAKSFLPGIWLLFSLTYARGNCREFVRRWRVALALAFLVPVGMMVSSPLGLITGTHQLEPGNDWLLRLGARGILIHAILLLTSVVILMNLESTFHSAVGIMRWRIKFMILGVSTLFVFRIYSCSQTLLFSSVSLSVKTVNAAALLVACLLMTRSLLRGKVFSVDIYPSQKLVYASFALFLSGSYIVAVGIVAKVIAVFGGGADLPLKSILVVLALAAFAVVGFSERLRQRFKDFVSRNLRRPLYDYRHIWTSVTEQTSSLVDDTALCRAVVKLTSDTFQALSVTIWLADTGKEQFVFAASTSLGESAGQNLVERQEDVRPLLGEMLKYPNPSDFNKHSEKWSESLRARNPSVFKQGGGLIFVPLIARGEALGLMSLGDRVNEAPFSAQDFDLLKCLADQTASDLLNIQLSQKLLQTKQMEAFQTVSAFFVHDLKNTASSLSLTLRNLPVHFDDPEFREDALRAISNSVDHLNELISRLSTLREKVELHKAEADLNEVVGQALRGFQGMRLANLVTVFGDAPKVSLDREQMQKVITNLVLNARDAVGGGGEIRVETGRHNGWAFLSVKDNGCGMSPEFVSRSLFRPFQTTKKNGTGIGMFQSKLIIEAHKGKIEVESRPREGSTFRVLLPLASEV